MSSSPEDSDSDDNISPEENLSASTLAALQSHLSAVKISSENNHIPEADQEQRTNTEKEKSSIEETAKKAPRPRSEFPLPKNNTEYSKKQYWEERFAAEEEFDWLVTYEDVAEQVNRFLEEQHRILLVGCGNSSFSADLYDAGFHNITNIDFSENVILAMRERNVQSRPRMKWEVMDMTNMTFPDKSFDVVIDKAAMDALMTNEGDVWNPDQSVIDSSRQMCFHVSRVLVDEGCHLHISFHQPHFRKKYLLGEHPHAAANANLEETPSPTSSTADDESCEFGWDYQVETIGGKSGCFNHFLYIMKKGSGKN